MSLFSLFPLALAFMTVLPAAAKAETPQLTPVVFQVLAGPLNPVQGSDGDYHLVYEIQLSNVSPQAWQVERVKALGGDKTVLELTGVELKSRMGPLGTRGGSNELGPNQTSFLWLHLKFPSRQAVPQQIRHQLSLSGGGKAVTMTGAEVAVSSEPLPVLASPLKGDRWLAGDGCCDSIRHVRALLPIDGRLYSSQRFAIDWEKLGEGDKIYSGDAKNPENYFCYGQEIVAVADGTVVAMVDGLPNQVPGKLPAGIDIAQADGNHVVLSLGANRYALYAHMKPGSIRVKVGDKVREGQVIGQVGNSGNTSEPHLHFHVMDGASPLASNGLPYVLKSFEVLGKVGTTQEFDKAAAEGTPLAIQPAKEAGSHRDQLPLDLSLVRFP